MKVENLDQAVRFKERLDKLNELKAVIEKNMPDGKVTFSARGGVESVTIQDDILTGILYKYCEDTIMLVKDAIGTL